MYTNDTLQNPEELFRKYFNIEIKDYDDKKLRLLIKELNKELDKRLEKEEKRYIELLRKLEKEEIILDSLLNGND